MTYNLHKIFLYFATAINLITIATSSAFIYENFNSQLRKEIIYLAIGILIFSFTITGLLFSYIYSEKFLYFKVLISLYVLLSINIILFIFFSFYKHDLKDKISSYQEVVFGLIIASFAISLLFFLLSDSFLLTKIENVFKNYQGKIVEYNQFYPDKENCFYIEKGVLKNNYPFDINSDKIILPLKFDNCQIKVLNNNCFFKDSDLYNKRYRGDTIKEIFDSFFNIIIKKIENGETVAFPKGEWTFEKAPLLTKYVNKYKEYLLLLSETYKENLGSYINKNNLLSPEDLYKLDPDFNNIRFERDRKNLIANSNMEDCDIIKNIIGERTNDYDEKKYRNMLTLTKDLEGHDEKKIELAKNLASKFEISEAKKLIKFLR